MLPEDLKSTELSLVPPTYFRLLLEATKTLEKLIEKREKQEEGLLTVEETIQFFSCTKSTLNNWKKNGTLLPRTIGGRVYYLKSDCLKSLQAYPTPKKGGRKNG